MKIAFNAPDDGPIENANINVVIFEEAGEWTAVALEMDLHAVAGTMEGAGRELAESVMAQRAFAIQKRQPELVFRNADPMYWRLFEPGARREAAGRSDSAGFAGQHRYNDAASG